jgi:hypothetical protein
MVVRCVSTVVVVCDRVRESSDRHSNSLLRIRSNFNTPPVAPTLNKTHNTLIVVVTAHAHTAIGAFIDTLHASVADAADTAL